MPVRNRQALLDHWPPSPGGGKDYGVTRCPVTRYPRFIGFGFLCWELGDRKIHLNQALLGLYVFSEEVVGPLSIDFPKFFVNLDCLRTIGLRCELRAQSVKYQRTILRFDF